MGDALTPVLVTGAAGYLGSRVLALLRARGCPAVGVARNGRAGVECNLLDAGAVSALIGAYPGSPVIHCAAVVPRALGDYASEEAASQSVAMVENLVATGAGPIVFASSMTVYPAGTSAAREEDAAVSEGYGGGKLRAEAVLRGVPDRRDVILRFPGLFGPPRANGLLFHAAVALSKGCAPFLAPVLPQWAAMHVDDAADLCVRALGVAGRDALVLNAGYEGSMSIPAAVAQIAEELGHDPGPLPRAPVFAFDLSRLHMVLGPAATGWTVRMREVAAMARSAASESAGA